MEEYVYYASSLKDAFGFVETVHENLLKENSKGISACYFDLVIDKLTFKNGTGKEVEGSIFAMNTNVEYLKDVADSLGKEGALIAKTISLEKDFVEYPAELMKYIIINGKEFLLVPSGKHGSKKKEKW